NAACSLLERDIRTVLLARGLHIGFGALHGVDDGRDALVYDFMELFRTGMVESVVLEAFNTKMLRPEHFVKYGDGQRMLSAGFASIIRAYEERAEGLIQSARSRRRVTWRRRMLEQAEEYAAYVEEGRTFEPFMLNY